MANNHSIELLNHRGGYLKNNLSHILRNMEDLDVTISCATESPYVNPADFVTYISNFKNQFCILSVNIQSIRSKFYSLNVFLRSLAENNFFFNVICVQESWVSKDFVNDRSFDIPGYNAFFLPSTCTAHAGLITYVLDNYECMNLNVYNASPAWECLPLKIYNWGLKKPVTILNIYRPPRARKNEIEIFLKEFTSVLGTLSGINQNIFITGDFNIDLLKINTQPLYSKYLELMYSFSFVPSITLPTRLSRHNASLIDHMFSKLSQSSACTISSSIVTSSISDHFMTFLCADI